MRAAFSWPHALLTSLSQVPKQFFPSRNHSKNHWWRSLEEMRISRSGSHSLFLFVSTPRQEGSVCPSNWLSCALCQQLNVNFVLFSFACPRNSLLAAYCVMSDSFCMCYGGPWFVCVVFHLFGGFQSTQVRTCSDVCHFLHCSTRASTTFRGVALSSVGVTTCELTLRSASSSVFLCLLVFRPCRHGVVLFRLFRSVFISAFAGDAASSSTPWRSPPSRSRRSPKSAPRRSPLPRPMKNPL